MRDFSLHSVILLFSPLGCMWCLKGVWQIVVVTRFVSTLFFLKAILSSNGTFFCWIYWFKRFFSNFSTRWLDYFHSPFFTAVLYDEKAIVFTTEQLWYAYNFNCRLCDRLGFSPSKLCTLEWSFTRHRDSWHARNQTSFRWNFVDGVVKAESFDPESSGGFGTFQSFWRKHRCREKHFQSIANGWYFFRFTWPHISNGDVFHSHDIFHQPYHRASFTLKALAGIEFPLFRRWDRFPRNWLEYWMSSMEICLCWRLRPQTHVSDVVNDATQMYRQ